MTYPVINLRTVAAPLARIMIATPCYGDSVFVPFMKSLMENMEHMEENDIEYKLITVSKESLITRARNGMSSQFIDDKDYTHLMFIDSDIEFPRDAIYKLAVANKDLVGALYPKKFLNMEKVQKFLKAEDPKFVEKSLDYVFTPTKLEMKMENHCVEVTDIGTGFMLIKRVVFERMIEKYPELEYKPFVNDDYGSDKKFWAFFNTMIHPAGHFLSEDYAFCWRWNEIGGSTHVRLDLPLIHHGKFYFGSNGGGFKSVCKIQYEKPADV